MEWARGVRRQWIYLMIPTVLFLIGVILYGRGLVINVTPSEAIGVYVADDKTTIAQGDRVLLCLTENVAKEGLEKQYLMPGSMRCETHDPLIKRILAVPGDTVVLTRDSIIVNGILYPYATKRIDSNGRRLWAYPRGVYSGTSGYWVIGTGSVDSWDSRYWGPITRSQILYPLKKWS